MTVTEEQRRVYAEDGVVALRGVFDTDWLDLIGRSIARGREAPGPNYLDYSSETRPGSYCTDLWIWRDNPEMRRFMFDSPAAALCGRLMGARSVMLVTDNWMVRESGAINRAPWHHDHPYFDVSGRWCVMWLGLEPVGRGEGVTFIRGSHRWDRLFMPLSFAGTGPKGPLQPPYEPMPDIDADPDRYEFLEFALEPGDCLVFDSRTVHGAPNPAPAVRTVRRLTMRFAPGDALFEKRGPWTDDQCAFLERHGHRPDRPLAGPMLPVLWEAMQ